MATALLFENISIQPVMIRPGGISFLEAPRAFFRESGRLNMNRIERASLWIESSN